MVVFIKQGEAYSKPVKYILGMLSVNKGQQIYYTDDKGGARLIFDHTDANSVPVNAGFFESLINQKKYNHEFYFTDKPRLTFDDGNVDYLGTAFYMVNAFQEYENTAGNYDNYGRFMFEKSYQYKFKCIEENIVQECFDKFCSENTIFQDTPVKKSRVFISHDIDTINGSFLQDGLWAMKRGRADVVLKLVTNEILRKPDWTNMDRIVKLHSDHDLKSTFFWLATKKVSENKVVNADYSTADIAKLSKLTSTNGLHKSAADYGFKEELEMLPFSTKINRYHFLKFQLPKALDIIEEAGIEMDASLGFAEQYGFRNNYGSPFRPYNLSTGGAYSFVETPLNLMDGTFQKYMKVPKEHTAAAIIDFIEKNNTNCVLSLLWHNTFFTSYKYGGYLAQYKKVLLYLNEAGIKAITPEEIVNEYR